MLNSSQNSLGISRFQHIFLAYSAPVLCPAIYLSICYPIMEVGSMNPLAVVHSLPIQDIQMLNHPLEDILVCKQLFHSYIFTKEGKQTAFAKASNNTNSILMFCFTSQSRFFSMVTWVRCLKSQRVSTGITLLIYRGHNASREDPMDPEPYSQSSMQFQV